MGKTNVPQALPKVNHTKLKTCRISLALSTTILCPPASPPPSPPPPPPAACCSARRLRLRPLPRPGGRGGGGGGGGGGGALPLTPAKRRRAWVARVWVNLMAKPDRAKCRSTRQVATASQRLRRFLGREWVGGLGGERSKGLEGEGGWVDGWVGGWVRRRLFLYLVAGLVPFGYQDSEGDGHLGDEPGGGQGGRERGGADVAQAMDEGGEGEAALHPLSFLFPFACPCLVGLWF